MLRRESDYSERNRDFRRTRFLAGRRPVKGECNSSYRQVAALFRGWRGRLAGYFDTPPQAVLRIAAGLPRRPVTGRPGASPQDDDYLVDELLEAFRQLPAEWKPGALVVVEMWARFASRQGIRIGGAAGDTPSPQG